MPVIVSTIPSNFKFYCAFIVYSKRAFFEFIVPVIVLSLASKFEVYCASIVSSYTTESETNRSLGSVWSKVNIFHMGLVLRKVILRQRLV